MTFASIVVPAFNVSATLAETLTSLLQQTHASYEVIIVDDQEVHSRLENSPRNQTTGRICKGGEVCGRILRVVQ